MGNVVAMGSCQSQEAADAKKVNNSIQNQILKDKERRNEIVKLLLLGAAESGKSTVLKQMRILHDNGFTEEEFRHQREVIRNNVITCMLTLLEERDKMGILFYNAALEEAARLIVQLSKLGITNESFSVDLIGAIKRVWNDKGIRKVYDRRNEYYITDSATYFLDAVERIGNPDYMPTEQDILRARVSTTGIIEAKFQLRPDVELRVIDVGGQRSERKKWIHCFDDVNGIIFVASLSGYDQVILEDNRTNRMAESLRLFSSVANSDFFLKAAIILFLNKIDLFAEKIGRNPLTVCFPDFRGSNTVEENVEYIEAEYKKVNKIPEKAIFVHKTCATDTSQMEFVIRTCFELILKRALQRAGLF